MDLLEETPVADRKRIVKLKVPQDYSPHTRTKKLVRKGKKKGKLATACKEPEFQCDNCGTENFVKGNKKSRKCRHVFDPETRKTLKLCNACGLKLKRKQNRKEKPTRIVKESEKEEYLQEGRAFGKDISELVNDDDAKHFFCPKFRGKPCRCLQTFMQSNMKDITEIKKRANLLLRYHKKAKELMNAAAEEGKSSKIRSKEFDHFILTNRDYLKSQLRLCEQAVQKVLGYSNNFLYKNKVEDGKRLAVKPTVGSEKLSIAPEEIIAVHNDKCRDVNCKAHLATLTNQDIVTWRHKSQTGQTSRKFVLRELVDTFSGQLCKDFMQLVTGAGSSCIARVAREVARETNKWKDADCDIL